MTMAGNRTTAEFDALFGQLQAAALGPALDALTAEVTLRALQSVQHGHVVNLGRPWETNGSPDNPHPAVHLMSKIAERVAGESEPVLYCDFVGTDFHNKRVTHIDALNHVAFRGRLFGGVPADSVLTGHGMTAMDVCDLGPIVTRGVLLDMAAASSVPWVEPGTAWSRGDLDHAESSLGVRIQRGDAVLLRSGSVRRRAELGGSDPDVSAGLHVDAVVWLAERGAAVLGSDDSSDARPSTVDGISLPVHTLVQVALGMPLIDSLDLEELSRACAAHQRWDFLLMVAPLTIPHATGSPVSPVAIF
jgi:kynurenine formamidase